MRRAVCYSTAVVMALIMNIAAAFPAEYVSAKELQSARVQPDEPEYDFDESRTAVEQLNALFTTLDLEDATIKELTSEMEAGHVTSEQITKMYIDRINAYDGKLKLNSIISIVPDALDQARKLDKEREAGHIRGPLHGIPVLVKDNIDVAGTPTTGGSLALAHMVSPTDSFAVKKLKDAGAVIIAKANLSEFASSAVDSKSLIGGVVHNPYDTSRVPAGSSGGTAVAVTSNFAAAGLGTDTGGSIRNPASYNNLYGIRPSKGLTSISGVIPLEAPRDTVGPMARTAEDMALILQSIAGTDENDDFTQEAGADSLLGNGYMGSLSEDGLKGKRIGYLTSSFEYTYPLDTDYPDEEQTSDYEDGSGDDGAQPASDEEGRTYENEGITSFPDEKIDAMVKRTRATIRKAGAEFVDLSSELSDDEIADLSDGASDNTVEYDFNRYLHEKGDAAPYKTLKELYLSGKEGIYHTNLPIWDLESLADSFEETNDPYDTEINGYMRGATWEKTLEGRRKVQSIMEENDIDAIMYIGSFSVPPTYANFAGQYKYSNGGLMYWFTFGPALGLPEVVVPMGFSDPDDDVQVELPLGMRFFGKFGDEETLMEIAYAYEKAAGSSIRRMPPNQPALEDQNLDAYLRALIEQAYSIDYDKYNEKPEGMVDVMDEICDQALKLDTTDPHDVYKTARRLAKQYDKVMQALDDSGLKKKATSFKVTLSRKTVKAAAKKKQKVTVKVTGLTKGSAKPVFAIKKVTNGQKAKVKVDRKTGTVTIKKKTGKCRIIVKAVSKETSTRKAKTVSFTIKVK